MWNNCDAVDDASVYAVIGIHCSTATEEMCRNLRLGGVIHVRCFLGYFFSFVRPVIHRYFLQLLGLREGDCHAPSISQGHERT